MSDLSRVVLVTPHRTVEMALPATVPLADLMPVLVHRAAGGGADPTGRNRSFNGEDDWILQRLGGGPLDEDLSPAALHIHNGETLYLRPRDAQLPPVHFDDLIDGLATGVGDRPDRWRDSLTRTMFLVIGAATLLTMYLVLIEATLPHRGALAGGIAIALAFCAMMCSRALSDGWAALTTAVAAVPFAGLFGYTVLPLEPGRPTTPQLLCAAVAASVCALLVTFGVGHYRAFFLAGWLVSVAGAGAVLLTVLGMSSTQAGAAAVTVTLLATGSAPSVAFRLALMRLPQLPTSSADLSEDIDPYPSEKVISGAVVADGYLTWLLGAAGVVCTVGLAIVIPAGGWAATSFVVAAIGVLAIRSRSLSSGWQRLATLTPVLVAGCLLTVRLVGNAGGLSSTVTVLMLLGATVLAIALSRALPGRRILPYWGRIADFVEYLFALGLVVLLFAVFDAFTWARTLAG
jgi:type VII secretion integral membrane protein EccD